MPNPKISVIFGTRPEAIKLAPVILALRRKKDLECHVCVTGQHRQMLDQVLTLFDIVPDIDLNLMQENHTLGAFTARAIAAIDEYLEQTKPDLVLVQGDTTTVFCAALAAFYHKISVGHVEAGLRTWNMLSPWPEEANRVLTTKLATLHFAPTESARQNLLRERIDDSVIHVTGNTVIDALFVALEKIRQTPPTITGLPPSVMQNGAPLVLITGHRRENFGAGLDNICLAIAELARGFPDAHFVYPVHLNPNVQAPVHRILGKETGLANVHLLSPVSYLEIVALLDRCTLILTDSGGIQEEAPSLGKPVLVMRDTTERPEAVDAGAIKLVGTERGRIVREAMRLLRTPSPCERVGPPLNPYGDGHAAPRIVAGCQAFLKQRT